jgi:hypothetical protein
MNQYLNIHKDSSLTVQQINENGTQEQAKTLPGIIQDISVSGELTINEKLRNGMNGTVKTVRGFQEQTITLSLLLVDGASSAIDQLSYIQNTFLTRNKDGSFVKFSLNHPVLVASNVRGVLFKKLTKSINSQDNSISCNLEFLEYDSLVYTQNVKIQEQNERIIEERRQQLEENKKKAAQTAEAARKKAEAATKKVKKAESDLASAQAQGNAALAAQKKAELEAAKAEKLKADADAEIERKRLALLGKTPKSVNPVPVAPGEKPYPDPLKTAATGISDGQATANALIPGAPNIKPSRP